MAYIECPRAGTPEEIRQSGKVNQVDFTYSSYRGTFINTAGLMEQGWDRQNIHEFLGSPDKLVANPINPGWVPMRLYSVKRVLRTMRSPAFRDWLRPRLQALEKDRAEATRNVAALATANATGY